MPGAILVQLVGNMLEAASVGVALEDPADDLSLKRLDLAPPEPGLVHVPVAAPAKGLTTRQVGKPGAGEEEGSGDGGDVLAGGGEPAAAEGDDAEGAASGALEER